MLAIAKQLRDTIKTDLKHVEGHDKLARRIESEIKFLKVHPDTPSSNVTSLNAIVETAVENLDNLVALLRAAEQGRSNSPSGYEQSAQVIDLVLKEHDERCFQQEQLVWMKVIARKGMSLHEHCMGRSDSKNRNIIEQAIDLAKISEKSTHNFSSIKVVFNFRRGVSNAVKKLLKEELNIEVLASEIFDDSYPEDMELLQDEYFDEPLIKVPQSFHYNQNSLNLDVTTMLSYCSNLANNADNTVHDWGATQYKLIALQAVSENSGLRVRPMIEKHLKGKHLIVCRTAYNDFKDIVYKIGGAEEKERAETLLSQVQVVDDQPSEQSLTLPVSQRMSDRSVAIFGTGDHLNIATITANVGFVRAAAQNGVSFCVLTHEPRVLSEEKQVLSFGDDSSSTKE